MTQTFDITAKIDDEGLSQSSDEMRSMIDTIEERGLSPSFGERFSDFVRGCDLGLFVLGDDGSDLIRTEFTFAAAAGANVLEAIKVLPSDRYLELFSALAAELDLGTVIGWHGWPVLSVGIGTTTVAEGAEPASTAPEAHPALEEIGPEARPFHAVPATGTTGSLQGNADG